ncbi:MAG: GGDEF domain-containing protein, partial [Nocardioides sp.]
MRRWWREPPVGASREATVAITGLIYLVAAIMYAGALIAYDGLGEPWWLQVAWVGTPLVVGVRLLTLRQRLPRTMESLSPIVALIVGLYFVVAADRGASSMPLALPIMTTLINSPFKFALRQVAFNAAVILTATAAVLHHLGVPAGDLILLVGSWVPMGLLMAWAARLSDNAEKDALTGLANRRGFERRFEAAATGYTDRLTVALLDLDGFKQVNDVLGHDAGDQLLVACAEAWGPLMPRGAVLARRGGDEFTLMTQSLNATDVDRLLDAMRLACPDQVTLSAGVASLIPGETTGELLHRADLAMYEAKRQGRDRVVRSRPLPAARRTGDDRLRQSVAASIT